MKYYCNNCNCANCRHKRRDLHQKYVLKVRRDEQVAKKMKAKWMQRTCTIKQLHFSTTRFKRGFLSLNFFDSREKLRPLMGTRLLNVMLKNGISTVKDVLNYKLYYWKGLQHVGSKTTQDLVKFLKMGVMYE